jgi:hypothetical protein
MSTPSFSVAVDLLLWGKYSLLVPASILVAGAVVTVILYRRGRRAEALVIRAVALLAPLYTSGHVGPFGDIGAGPRYLITLVPFLAIPLAIAYVSSPRLQLCSRVCRSCGWSRLYSDAPASIVGRAVLDRLTAPGFASYACTATELVGVSGPARLAPFAPALVAAVAGAAVAARVRRPRVADLVSAAVALGASAAVVLFVPPLLRSGLDLTLRALLALAFTVGVIVAVWLFESGLRPRAFGVCTGRTTAIQPR